MLNSQVVVGTTDGQNSAAIQFALAEAGRLDRVLRIVHVMVDPARETASAEGIGHVLDEQLQSVPIESVTVTGDPAEVFLRESASAFCIVLPSGDVANWVAKHATRPVVVVPATSALQASGSRIVVSVDLKRPIGGPLAYGIEMAELRGVALEVMFAAGATSDYPERQQLLSQLEDIIDPWRPMHPFVPIHVSVEGGHPVRSCLAAAAHASLMVVGSPQATGPRIGSWSVASKIVDRSPVPVVVVPYEYTPTAVPAGAAI